MIVFPVTACYKSCSTNGLRSFFVEALSTKLFLHCPAEGMAKLLQLQLTGFLLLLYAAYCQCQRKLLYNKEPGFF